MSNVHFQALEQQPAFVRGRVKTLAERASRRTRLTRSPRTGFEAVREG